MKPGSNRRPRTRPNNINNNSSKRQGGKSSYDSNGPDGKVRGTAQQVLEKYQALGRDASSAGDRVSAEAYFQFAEHYYRVVNLEGGGSQSRREMRPNEEAELETTENQQVAPSAAAQAALAPKSRPKQSAVEVLNVPIMPGPIDVLIAEEQSPDQSNDKVQEPVVVADDDVAEDKPKPVRRRRARAKPAVKKAESESEPVEA
jgi:hypothetical protein